ncbi:ThiF family adenylyltransferase [Nonomuraea sp. SMC257]|uniref:ThiF family adenylyltransferase n=1 Tax=Nonomuraea montanisoli TaxID=2741721 RepID=A0A7Y6M101_9ACTN|nr:ThiF family adenylyltransferase [Nonomuraea montanisoli]NUW31068.1 ThiF family adenylyltransferase [Nonomuraea montanisoli]
MRVRITDHALRAIVTRIGGVPPEAGGALFGPPGTDLVTGLLPDERATATDVRYHTSAWLIEQAARTQRDGAARFKGIVHSHPADLPEPSGQDRREFGRSLGLNPHLGRFLAPIVTHDDRPPAAHELVSGGVRVSWYGAVSAEGRVEVLPMHPLVLPVAESLARAGAREEGEPEVLTVDGAPVIAVPVRFEALPSVSVALFGADFPAVPPVLVTHGSPVALTWDLAAPAADRLARAVSGARRPGRPPSAVRTRLLAARERAAAPVRRRRATGLFARSAGLVSPALADRHVVVAGAGSVGAYVAECLVRSGVGRLTVVDPERVAPENLGRSPYTVGDVGRPKVSALASRLATINPELTVRGERSSVQALDPRDLAATLRDGDLLVAATDDNRAQRRLDHLAYWTGVPAIFPGLYRGAAGGEVIMTYPGSACWGCATAGVRDLSADTALAQPTNYGTGRLLAEPGLVVDIQHVSAAAAKIGLALLHGSGGETRIEGFLAGPRERGQSYVAFGTEPGYWLFGHVLRDAPGQHAFQTVWMSVDRRPGCPVCGPEDERTDPLAGGARDVSPERLRHLAGRGRRP